MSCLGPRITMLLPYSISLTQLLIRSLQLVIPTSLPTSNWPGDVIPGDLGIEGVDDLEEVEDDEPPAGDDANNLLEDFNENELIGELRNNQQP
jgi:hypothetical protein